LKKNKVSGGYFKYDAYMKVSDYNVLRGYLGLNEISLEENQYLLHCVASISKHYQNSIDYINSIEINGNKFNCKGIYDEDFAQNGQNGAGYIVVVPDYVANNMEVYYSQYVCDTSKETNNKLYVNLLNYVEQDAANWSTSANRKEELDHGMGLDSMYAIFDNVMVKNGGLVSEVEAAIITVVSSIFYVALVFICVALTILAVQQLSDSTKYSYRYRVLHNMGVDKDARAKLILKQLLIYFGCPIIIPILVSLVISYKLNNILMTGTQIQKSNYIFFIIALGLFMLVYSIYFSVTYLCFKKNVEID
jgi:hypothetical protein